MKKTELKGLLDFLTYIYLKHGELGLHFAVDLLDYFHTFSYRYYSDRDRDKINFLIDFMTDFYIAYPYDFEECKQVDFIFWHHVGFNKLIEFDRYLEDKDFIFDSSIKQFLLDNVL